MIAKCVGRIRILDTFIPAQEEGAMLRVSNPHRRGPLKLEVAVIVCDREEWRTMEEASSPLWTAAFAGDMVVATAVHLDPAPAPLGSPTGQLVQQN